MSNRETTAVAFRSGSIAGFYDAKPDEGLRYRDDYLRCALTPEHVTAFIKGYAVGRALRLSGDDLRSWRERE